MSRSMENIISKVRPLQLCLILTLLINICATWPQRETESDNFIFPTDNQASLTGTRLLTETTQNCQWPQVWYQSTRRCEELLTTGPCGTGQWFVLGRGDVPQCQTMQCTNTEISYKGQCVPLGDTTRCPPGMAIVATVMGIGDCDCKAGHAYWTTTSNTSRPQQDVCYPLYEQGPCPDRQILHIPNVENAKATCQVSRCNKGEVEIVVRNGNLHLAQIGRGRGTCQVLRQQGPCIRGKIIEIDPATSKLSCLPLQIRTLINAPTLNCSPGSKRDALGRCRRSMF